MPKLKVKEPLQFSATHSRHSQSPRKARLVMDMVRGKSVVDALTILKFTHNRAARHIEKLVKSAAANAEDHSNRGNLGVDAEQLVLSEAMVGVGPNLGRWRPVSRGASHRYKRYRCNLSVKLCRPDDLEALKFYRRIVSQKLRVDRIKDLKGLEIVGAATETAPAKTEEPKKEEAAQEKPADEAPKKKAPAKKAASKKKTAKNSTSKKPSKKTASKKDDDKSEEGK